MDNLELVHLGIDRFQQANRSMNISEEDAFCIRLGHMGAKLWPHELAYIDAILGEGDINKLAQRVYTGWPSSGKGVWVLEYVHNNRDTEMRRWRSLLKHSVTMDERCGIIEQAGGTFYSNPDDCAALTPLSNR